MTDTKPIWARRVKLSKQEILERFGEVPTPEEIEAAARAMCDLGVPADVSIWDQGAPHKKIYYRQLAEAALKAAMAVRRGK